MRLNGIILDFTEKYKTEKGPPIKIIGAQNETYFYI